MNAPQTIATDSPVMKPNYPRNLWWLALPSADLADQPVGLWILDEPVVLYRRSDGTAVALDNRCPHRWAPLSEGKVMGDNIACPYHGFEFNPEGACVKIPSQEKIPSRACVKSYPLIEKDTLIWIWMGDPDKASEDKIPVETDWLRPESEWSYASGSTVIDANFQLLKENILDLTHLPFVHANSIGVSDWTTPPQVETDGNTVTYQQQFPATPLRPVYGVPTGIGMEKPAIRHNWGISYSPAAHRGFVEITDPNPAPGARDRFLFGVMHLVTPESPTRMRYHWFMGWDIDLSEDYLDAMRENVPKGFGEDKFILEKVQQMILRDPRHLDYPEIIVQADQAAIQSRRKLQALLDAEKEQV